MLTMEMVFTLRKQVHTSPQSADVWAVNTQGILAWCQLWTEAKSAANYHLCYFASLFIIQKINT